MRKFTIAALFCTLYIVNYTFAQSVIAAESTPSAAVKDKLQALQTEIASKAAKLKTEISKKLQNKAYIGIVKSKSASTLTLAARSGTKVVNINQDTIYDPVSLTTSPRSGGGAGKKGALKEENYIAALGDVDETGVLTARKIVLLANGQPQSKTVLWGQLISISDNLATISDKSGKNIALSLKTPTPVKQNQFIIVSGYFGKNDILNAKFLFVIPGKENIKTASPSAEASKSATPSAKKK